MKAERILPQGFYVYTHHRADTGEVFYVGKGHGKRAWKTGNRSEYWKRIREKHGFEVRIVAENLSERDALVLEIRVIASIPPNLLCNLTIGGDGVTRIGGMPESQKKNISAANKIAHAGRRPSEAVIQSLIAASKLAIRTPEWKRNISEAHKGRRQTPDSVAKAMATKRKNGPSQKFISALKERSESVVCVQTGMTFESQSQAAAWLREIGIRKASQSAVSRCARGGTMKAYGFTWRYAGNFLAHAA